MYGHQVIMEKKYYSETTGRTPRPRSKRLRELGVAASGSGGSTVVSVSGGGMSDGGGDGHTHANKAALDEISTDSERYLWLTKTEEIENPDAETPDEETSVRRVARKAKAGWADAAWDLDPESPAYKRWLRKDREDTAEGLLRLLKGAHFGEFVNSMTAGKGGGIDEHGNAQLESLEVRSYMKVMELIINRLSAQEGDFNFTESGTIEKAEELEAGTWLLTMRKRWEYDFTPFKENDVIYGSINTLQADGSYITSWMRVLSVDTTANTLTVATYADADVPAGRNFGPVASMNVSRRGNATDTERQSCWYISSYEGCIMYLEGVTKPILDERNYYLTLGRPKTLSLFNGLPINYNHPYLYARGAIIQDLLRVDFAGNPVYEVVDLGLWQETEEYIRGYSEGQSRYIQHQVWWKSCCWRCVVEKATVGIAPRWNNAQWVCVVGDGNYTLEITSSSGHLLRYGREFTTLGYVLKHGDMDISVDAWQVKWTRESGLWEEDLLWNIEHAESGEAVSITPQDMPTNWAEERRVTFRCTVTLKDGEDAREIPGEMTIRT